MKRFLLVLACLGSVSTAHSTGHSAQSNRSTRRAVLCEPTWQPTFGAPGMNHGVYALETLDLGGGPRLYAGGQFTRAGGVAATHIAEWDGTSWSSVGAGLGLDFDSSVFALAGFDDGSGLALYAGGDFTNAEGSPANRIARWDGASWTTLGAGMEGATGDVRALAVFDDGGGPALFAGGSFLAAGGVAANNVAKWNGTSWTPLSTGTNDVVESLAVFDDGSGAALYAGGHFTRAGGLIVNRIARWNGTSWSAVGGGGNNAVYALAVFDDGSGAALHAGGLFTLIGGVGANHVARWNGASWSALGSGISGSVAAMRVFDDGSGPALFAGGNFTTAGGLPASCLARWNGTSWAPLGSGADDAVRALAVFDDGGGAKLEVGGTFSHAGSLSAHAVAAWDGSWSNLDAGAENELLAPVLALKLFDDGTGTALYAGGAFTAAGLTPAGHVARWNGTSWSAVGPGTNSAPLGIGVGALEVFDDGLGGGPALYAGGDFTFAGGAPANGIARWDGTSWSPLGNGVTGSIVPVPAVHCLAVFDDGNGGGPALHVGGNFTNAGGVPAFGIAKWDGLAWSTLRNGLAGPVQALAVFDDGSGAALYAGGEFVQTGGGQTVNHVARWNGTSWSALGLGTDDHVLALAVYDDGDGAALYAGGYFSAAGGAPANRIARWDGASWSALGSGLGGGFNRYVSELAVFDDGSGPALHAGGRFSSAGGNPANGIARWNGAGWARLGGGADVVNAMASSNGPSGPALYVGGFFRAANDSLDRNLSRWQGCDTRPPTIVCPGPFYVSDAGAPGELVSYTVTASDASDPAPSLVCTPASGSFFPRGVTLVKCTATDAAGNQASCEFEILVGNKIRVR